MKKSAKCILFIIVDILLIIFVLLGILTIAEYRPKAIEKVNFMASKNSVQYSDLAEKFKNQESITITTWNIGYAGLDETQDFFMDGGKNVRPTSKESIQTNLQEITAFINSHNSDIWFIQEVDENSKRSYKINQIEYLAEQTQMGVVYAPNHECVYVPFPLPTLGKVMSGVASYSHHELQNSERIQLPVSFSWPVRIANTKRCLLVSRLDLGEGNPELVVINVHLEAYDNNEGKIAQTKILVDLLETEYNKGNYVIAGGDFNQSFPGYTDLRHIDEDVWIPGTLVQNITPSAKWTLTTGSNAPTGRSLHAPLKDSNKEEWLYYVIDGFITSPNISVQKTETIDLKFKHSDHNPVSVEIILQ